MKINLTREQAVKVFERVASGDPDPELAPFLSVLSERLNTTVPQVMLSPEELVALCWTARESIGRFGGVAEGLLATRLQRLQAAIPKLEAMRDRALARALARDQGPR